MVSSTSKRLSGRLELDEERFELDRSWRDGERREMLGCNKRSGLGMRLRGSADGRTAAEDIVAEMIRKGSMDFIVTFERNFRVLKSFSSTAFRWHYSWPRRRTFHPNFLMKPTKPRERHYSHVVSAIRIPLYAGSQSML